MNNELIERIHAWEFLAHRNEAEDIGQLLADIKQALELPKGEYVPMNKVDRLQWRQSEWDNERFIIELESEVVRRMKEQGLV